ncbi:RAD50-interacting protein 1 [Macrosteles quadrilineatus]|uniref:RAD50-interacting protein 1 n=1 Tax=Macrosteles quadrilineatus TaxID=74068 RepID=UPI0023E23FE7|nr:RAD50-interacting protein 1 [Macrosteles quadrilineatus]
MIENSVKKLVIEKLNKEFGNDITNLSKCKDLCKKLAEEKEKIEREIIKASADLTSPETINEFNDTSVTVDEITKQFSELCKVVKEKDSCNCESLIGQQENIIRIQELEQGLSYLRCVRTIQDHSTNIEMFLASRSESEAVTEFRLLSQMCGRLHTSSCHHLITFLSDTVHHWHNLLKDMFSEQLDEVLKSAGWPIVSSNILITPPLDIMAKFQIIVKHLLNIQLPPELSPSPTVTSSLLSNFPPISLPINLLIRPLRKRFIYHFCGNKETNKPEKTEWYMTQVVNWIRDHESFVMSWVQPVYNQTQRTKMSAKVELMQGLVQLVVDKLHGDMPVLMTNDVWFSHMVDETLGFDKQLRECYCYPETLPSAITVLTQAHVFVKWIHMERKYARDKMDHILSSENAWNEVTGHEELRITEAAEAFLTLLQTMTDRYSILPQPGHRLQFVELQLELVDELRVRLLQLLHSERQDPLDSQLPAILNTAAYIIEVLHEWGASPQFLMLQHYKSQLESAGKTLSSLESATLKQGTLFDNTLSLLQHLVQELVDVLCEAVMMEVKARSRPYRKDVWFAMNYETTLTPSACPMFQVLVSKLHSLQSLLASCLFTLAWQSVATQLCTFLLEELVLQNRFNEGGAKQLEQDLNRSLIPLFHQYTQKPEAYFLPLKEACALLNVRPPPPEWSKGKYDKPPMEIHHLTRELVREVIQRRADVIPDLI